MNSRSSTPEPNLDELKKTRKEVARFNAKALLKDKELAKLRLDNAKLKCDLIKQQADFALLRLNYECTREQLQYKTLALQQVKIKNRQLVEQFYQINKPNNHRLFSYTTPQSAPSSQQMALKTLRPNR